MEENIQALENLVELAGKRVILITSVPTHPKLTLHICCNLSGVGMKWSSKTIAVVLEAFKKHLEALKSSMYEN